MDDSNDLNGGRLRAVDNGVIRIAGQRPETKRTSREAGSGMATQGRLGDKRASGIDRLFNAVGGVFVIIGDIRPDVENIGFGKRRESITGHRLAERLSSFSARISRRACAPSISSPRSAWR